MRTYTSTDGSVVVPPRPPPIASKASVAGDPRGLDRSERGIRRSASPITAARSRRRNKTTTGNGMWESQQDRNATATGADAPGIPSPNAHHPRKSPT
jgi:hypothetical protein